MHQAADHPWLHEDRSVITLVSLGRLEPQKNYELLIDAFSLLSPSLPCRLLVFGEGSLRDSLEQQISVAGLDNVIELPGYAENPFAVLHAADLFVLSSNWEGLPTVAIEALACGTRVVSTDNSTGIREIISSREAGALVDCGDAQALATAIAQVLESPDPGPTLATLTDKYRDTAVAEEHLALYDMLLTAKLQSVRAHAEG